MGVQPWSPEEQSSAAPRPRDLGVKSISWIQRGWPSKENRDKTLLRACPKLKSQSGGPGLPSLPVGWGSGAYSGPGRPGLRTQRSRLCPLQAAQGWPG